MRCLSLVLVVDVVAIAFNNFSSNLLIVSMEWLPLRGDVWLQKLLDFYCRISLGFVLVGGINTHMGWIFAFNHSALLCYLQIKINLC